MTKTPAPNYVGTIQTELTRLGSSVKWLADVTLIPHPTMRRRMGGVSPFRATELERIATALGYELTSDLVAEAEQATA